MPGSYPVLYSFRRCPFAMRARLALVASEEVCELRELVLASKPAELLQASPKATVPVLVLPPWRSAGAEPGHHAVGSASQRSAALVARKRR
jgi:glutathione S-transferase